MAGNSQQNSQEIDKPLPNRFTCEICGEEYRRSSAKKQREEAPICPVCAKHKVYQKYVQPSTIPK
jgi:transcription elongation factor Elf1